jgi:hypothetical protein
VRIARFSVTTTAAAANASTIELTRLPVGAVVISGAIKWADLDSGSGTMDVGYNDGTTTDADGIASLLDTSAAGTAALPEAVSFLPIEMAGASSIYATLNEGTAVLAGLVTGYLLYVVNS